MSGMYIG